MNKAAIVDNGFAEWWEREASKSPEWGHQYAIMDLTRIIMQAMESQNVTQAELARRADLKPSYVSRVLNTPENITMRTAFRLCNALDLDLGFDIKPKPEPLHQSAKAARPKARRKPASASKPSSQKAKV